ncbi:MAG: hypothetical protein ACLGHN_11330 [Bacteriovoracia bacterium]
MFASQTSVPVEKSIEEIRVFLTKIGTEGFSFAAYDGDAYLAFSFQGKAVKMCFKIPVHPGKEATIAQMKKYEQARRSKWRQILLCIKAKFECVLCELETFEQAFLAHIILKDGEKLGDVAMRLISDIPDKEIPGHLGFSKKKLKTA